MSSWCKISLEFAAHVTQVVEEWLPLLLHDAVVDALDLLQGRLEVRLRLSKAENQSVTLPNRN